MGIVCLDNFNHCGQASEEDCKKSKFCWKLAHTVRIFSIFSFHFPRLILFLLFVFQAQPTARAYVAYADNEEGMKGWISVILKQLDGGQGACSFLYSEAFLQQTPLILHRGGYTTTSRRDFFCPSATQSDARHKESPNPKGKEGPHQKASCQDL